MRLCGRTLHPAGRGRRRFTPMLTKAYHLLKARGDKFEVLFVSNDKSSEVRAARGLHRSEGGAQTDIRGLQRGQEGGAEGADLWSRFRPTAVPR